MPIYERVKSVVEKLDIEDRKLLLEFIKEVHSEGWGSYATPCAPANSSDEAWAESGIEQYLFPVAKTFIQEKLLSDYYYRPYCGNCKCMAMQRTFMREECVLVCGVCGWESDFDPEFIKMYEEAHNGSC